MYIYKFQFRGSSESSRSNTGIPWHAGWISSNWKKEVVKAYLISLLSICHITWFVSTLQVYFYYHLKFIVA